MREVLWLVLRTREVRCFAAAAAVTSVLASGSVALSASGAWSAGFDNARYFVLYAGPLLHGALCGRLTSARAFETWQLAGARVEIVHLRLMSVILLIETASAALVALASRVTARIEPMPGGSGTAHQAWMDAVYSALTLIGQFSACVLLARRRGSVGAVAACLVVPMVDTLLYNSQVPGRLLWMALWPSTSGGFVARGTGVHDLALVAMGASSLAVSCFVAVMSLGQPPSRRRSRPRRGSTVSGPLRTVTLMTGVVVGGLLPILVAQLPARVQPSTLIQRAEGRAPEQVAAAFFQYYRQGDHARASSMTVSEATSDEVVAPLSREMLTNDAAANFVLAAMPSMLQARVRGQVGPAVVCLTLAVEARPGWRVRSARRGDCS